MSRILDFRFSQTQLSYSNDRFILGGEGLISPNVGLQEIELMVEDDEVGIRAKGQSPFSVGNAEETSRMQSSHVNRLNH